MAGFQIGILCASARRDTPHPEGMLVEPRQLPDQICWATPRETPRC
jgi:hypothetical protein